MTSNFTVTKKMNYNEGVELLISFSKDLKHIVARFKANCRNVTVDKGQCNRSKHVRISIILQITCFL